MRQVIIYPGEDGYWVAECPTLPGCISQGESREEAVTNISEVIGTTLAKAGISVSDIDWFVPHQANKRILDGAARRLGLDPKRIIITVDKHANTSAASIPLALNTGCADGRIKPGDLVLMEAMGGGFTWGALLLRW